MGYEKCCLNSTQFMDWMEELLLFILFKYPIYYRYFDLLNGPTCQNLHHTQVVDVQCYHRNEPEKDIIMCVSWMRAHQLSMGNLTAGITSWNDDGVAWKIAVHGVCSVTVTDSKAERKQETKENLHKDSLQRMQWVRWGKTVCVKGANNWRKGREKETKKIFFKKIIIIIIIKDKLKKLWLKYKQELKGEWKMRKLMTENGEKTDSNGKEKNEKLCRKVNRKRKSKRWGKQGENP